MPQPPERFQFIADRGDSRLRLDQILVRRVSAVSRLSRTSAQQWIASGAVELDGRVATRASSPVREGVTVLVTIPSSAALRTRPAAESGALDILYEDDALMAVAKPPGVVVHPTYKQTSGTILNAVLFRVRDRGVTPGVLTRLDKDTSGLVLIALSPGVHRAVQRDAAAGRVVKEYLAVVKGRPHPRAGRITSSLMRDPGDRRRMITSPDGAPSETRYEVTQTDRSTSLVCCQLVTGRTHQIRVHLSSRGWPIVGDRVYGEASPRIPRQALHAWRVSLPHPITGAPLRIEAPLPDDFSALVRRVPAG